MLEDDIAPITLIELSLVLIFFILLLYYINIPGSRNYGKVEEDITKLNRQVVQLETSLRQCKAEIKKYKDKDLKSKLVPTCKEIGLTNETFLFTVTIVEGNRFQILNKAYSYADLKELYRSEIAKAKKYKCLYCVEAFGKQGISFDEYHQANAKLRKLFYVTPKGTK